MLPFFLYSKVFVNCLIVHPEDVLLMSENYFDQLVALEEASV